MSVVEAADETVSSESEGDLDRQAELAEAVKAKAAFGAMLTDDANDREQYERLRDEALEILQAINDEFYAGFARHQIIRLCIGAGEPDRAAALLAEVEDEFILDEIHDEFPDLMPILAPTR
ncbi:hypothetical protein VQ044_22825 [Aurantimonas sp. C2-5-R2]|uniref:hypothetical protein n=1 Tax=unclassified Aurantimonas TaxID=2638230 RepID=UPI002E177B72|nr:MULTISPECIES: hypothetical protein [unclassified Aurantimonas]MEC5293412.1 hypothetical protein [Aurantimonas sp. C2-3-R2]MEC5414493.1 hypothetical protein [Aurantimonas sp. C2-4-R8]